MAIRQLGDLKPELDDSAYIDDSAQLIGDVKVGADSSVWPLSVIRGDIHSIRIGNKTNIQDGSVLHVTHDSRFQPGGFALDVGCEVTVGHNVILHGCSIADRCLIGMGSTIMDGVTIEAEVMVAAGSLVTPGKSLKSGYLWVGRPARPVRELNLEEREYLVYAANHYVKLKNRYKKEHNS